MMTIPQMMSRVLDAMGLPPTQGGHMSPILTADRSGRSIRVIFRSEMWIDVTFDSFPYLEVCEDSADQIEAIERVADLAKSYLDGHFRVDRFGPARRRTLQVRGKTWTASMREGRTPSVSFQRID